MSLKLFHVIFIVSAIILSFGFGIWALQYYREHGLAGYLGQGIASLIVGLGLVVYLNKVIQKLKNIK